MRVFQYPPSTWAPVTQGIVLMLLATFTSAIMSALAKFLVEDYSSAQILFFRCAVALLVVIAWARHRGWSVSLRTPLWRAQILRGLLNIVSLVFYVAPMAYLSLAEVVALSFTQPIFVAVLSVPLLGERVDFRCWVAILVGFAGTLIMLRPGLGTEHIVAEFVVILGALLWAISLVMVRSLSATEASTTIVIYFLLVGAITSGLASPFVWVTPTTVDWLLLGLIGIVSAVGQFTMTEAFRRAPAPVVSPFFYAMLIWTTGLGYVFWGEIPDRYVAAGAVGLLVSGIYLGMYGGRVTR